MKGVTYGMLALSALGILTFFIVIAACMVGFDGVELALWILISSSVTTLVGVLSGKTLQDRQLRTKALEIEDFEPWKSECELLDELLKEIAPSFSVKRRRALVDNDAAKKLIAAIKAAREDENTHLTDANRFKQLKRAGEDALRHVRRRVQVANSRFKVKDGD